MQRLFSCFQNSDSHKTPKYISRKKTMELVRVFGKKSPQDLLGQKTEYISQRWEISDLALCVSRTPARRLNGIHLSDLLDQGSTSASTVSVIRISAHQRERKTNNTNYSLVILFGIIYFLLEKLKHFVRKTEQNTVFLKFIIYF